MINIEGKVAIITGASSGIGEATARILVANGMKVALSARRKDRLEALEKLLGSDNVVWVESDVTNIASLQALVSLAKHKFGRVDVMFANAGIMPAGNMSELKIENWKSMVDVNIMGVLNSMAVVLPEFKEQKSGHIIVTSSSAGLKPVPGNAVYSGTKHFVKGMLESFRQEAIAENSNIRTTLIYPGAVKTELLNMVAPSATKDMVEQFYEAVGITPDIIANAVLYSVSQPDNVDVCDLVVRPSKEA